MEDEGQLDVIELVGGADSSVAVASACHFDDLCSNPGRGLNQVVTMSGRDN